MGVILFLKMLHEDNSIAFDGSKWEWDLEKIRGCRMTGAIIDLVIEELHLLSEDCQKVELYWMLVLIQ